MAKSGDMDQFPIRVSHTIGDLFGKPPNIVESRTENEQRDLRDERLRKMKFLEDYFISRFTAAIGLNLIWKDRAPFCLFLRSYSLGHHLTDMSGLDSRLCLQVSEPEGGRLLRPLSDILGQRVALVAVANPDEALPHRLLAGPFINVAVESDEWRHVVSSLMDAARVIVVHREGPSPGVDHEVALLQEKGHSFRTLVVREPELPLPQPAIGDPVAAAMSLGSRRIAAREAARRGEHVFPVDHTIYGLRSLEWRDDKSLFAQLSMGIDFILTINPPGRFGSLPPIDISWGSTAKEAEYLKCAQDAYTAASQLLKTGHLSMAEELLFDSYASSCAANDLGGRASSCLGLGRLFLTRLWDAQAAITPLEYASGHFCNMEATDRALEALHAYSAAQLLCGRGDGAREIIEIAERLEQSASNRAWQRSFWSFVLRHRGTQDMADFLAALKMNR